MEYRENPLLGRKVFFLNPPLSIENNVLDRLRNEDYEVYVINELSCAKPVLRNYKNAICFIYIDDILSLEGWYNFIKSFEEEKDLESVFLGVISAKTKVKEQEKFLMNLRLPGGFVTLDSKIEKLTETLEGILRINGARGVRTCIRLELKDNDEVNGYFGQKSFLYSLKLIDISTMGFAAVCPAKMAGVFKKGSFLKNVSITMKRYSFICSVMIYAVKITGDVCTVIALLTNDTSKEVLHKIHDFVYDTLEERHKVFISSIAHDFTDYSKYRPAGTTPESELEEELETIESPETDNESAEEEKS